MKYLFIRENRVDEIIPDKNPIFPGIPITERYPAAFLDQCIAVSDDTEVSQNWTYDPETQTLSEPVVEVVDPIIDSGSGEETSPEETPPVEV